MNPIMKKSFYIITAFAFAFSACSKEVAPAEDNVVSGETTGNQITYTLTARFSDETKVTTTSAGVFSWEAEETIAVWDTVSESFINFTYSGSASSSATFSASLDANTDYNFTMAYYPSSVVNKVDGAYKVTFPYNYDLSSTSPKPILASKVDGTSITFHQLSSLVHVRITDIPSIASSVILRGNGIQGTVTVDPDDYSLSGLTYSHNEINLNNPAGGDGDFFIPVIPGTYKLGLDIYSLAVSNYLYIKSGSGNKTLAQNQLINMKPITINPTVYLISDLTSWTAAEACVMNGTGTSRTATLAGNTDKYYRYVVDYGTAQINMGPATDGSTSTSEVFVVGSTASKLTAYGNYNFSFDYTDGSNSVSVNPASPVIYLTGSFQTPTTWALNNDTPLTMVNAKEGYLAMNVAANSSFKAYTNPYWGSAFPGDNVNLATANWYLFVGNAEAGTLQGVFANADASTASTMTLNGSFNGWSGLNMIHIDSTPFWYADVDWDAQTEFRFVADGNWLSYGDGSYATPSASQDWNGNNIRVVTGKYRIIASEKDGRFAILARE